MQQMKTKLDVIDVNEKAEIRKGQEQSRDRRKQRERIRAKKLAAKKRRRQKLIRLGILTAVMTALFFIVGDMWRKELAADSNQSIANNQLAGGGAGTAEADSALSYDIVYPEFYRNHTLEVLEERETYRALKRLAEAYPEFEAIYKERESYPIELLAALCNNPEMREYTEGYLLYQNGDRTVAGVPQLTEKEKAQSHPLFLQWDKRWGYNEYGDFNIALSGCGPTCLSMVLVALNRDYEMTPEKVAEFSMKNGFYVEGTGTAWSLMTDGAAELGVSAAEISLDEQVMKNQLDAGKMIICSVRPGSFTTTGHFIVIYDYDENGFRVNDPNCIYRSSKSWTYQELAAQIRILWAYGKK